MCKLSSGKILYKGNCCLNCVYFAQKYFPECDFFVTRRSMLKGVLCLFVLLEVITNIL